MWSCCGAASITAKRCRGSRGASRVCLLYEQEYRREIIAVQYDSPYDPTTAPKDLEHVIYEKKGNVAYVTINRPEVRNALHSYAYVELRSCWRDIALDPNVYVGIVTGAGKAFCAGRDVKFLAKYQAEGKRTPHEDPNSPIFHWGGGGQPQDVELEKP